MPLRGGDQFFHHENGPLLRRVNQKNKKLVELGALLSHFVAFEQLGSHGAL